VTAKPYQTIFEELDGGSRAAFRGEPEPEPQRELPPADDDGALDVEIVDADEDNWPIPEPWQDDERPADEHTEPQPSPFAPVNPPAPDGLMSYDAAVSAAAAMRRNAVSRRAQRALPPGRSDNEMRCGTTRFRSGDAQASDNHQTLCRYSGADLADMRSIRQISYLPGFVLPAWTTPQRSRPGAHRLRTDTSGMLSRSNVPALPSFPRSSHQPAPSWYRRSGADRDG
jgi:hypothetical protein